MSETRSHQAPVHQARDLPVRPTGKLIGRDTALAQVYNQLKARHPVLVHGPAGVGKSALAAAIASAAYVQQPGGVLWMAVENPRLEALLVRVGRAYGIEEITSSENPIGMIGAVQNTLASNKPFIVLDGTIMPDVASRFISQCANDLPVMITNQDKLDGGWAALELNRLTPDEGAALFRQEGRLGDDADLDQLKQLAELVDYLPLGIMIGARTMTASKQSPADFYNLLEQIANATGGKGPVAALTTSLRALNGAIQGLMLIMGATFKGEASAELLSMVSNVPPESVTQAMDILSRLGLVIRTTRYDLPYYQLHPTTHAFVQTWLNNSNRLEELQVKMRDSLVAYAQKYREASETAYDKLAMEVDNFVAASHWANARDDRTTTSELIATLTQAGDFISERGYLYELLLLRGVSSGSATPFPAYAPEDIAVGDVDDEEEDYFEDDESMETPPATAPEDLSPEEVIEAEVEEITSAEPGEPVQPAPVDEPAEESDSQRLGALLEGFQDAAADPSAAADEEAIAVPDSILEMDQQPDTIADVEEVEAESAEDEEAEDEEEELDESLAATFISNVPTEDDDGFALAPLEESEINLESEDLTELRSNLAHMRQAGNLDKQIQVLKATGQVQVKQGMENEAIGTYSELLDAYEDAGDQEGMLDTLDMLSALMVKTENSQAAVMYATRGVKMAHEMGDVDTRMHLLTTLGDARQQLGESTASIQDYRQALSLARTADDYQHEAIILHKLGFAHLDNAEPETAINIWEQALELFREQGKREYEGKTLGGLGNAHGDMDRWGEAINYHKSAMHIARELDDKQQEAEQLNSLAYAATRAGQLGEAVLRYRQALHLAYANEDRGMIVSTIVDLSRLLVESRRHVTMAKLLITDALNYEPNDMDVNQLKERIDSEYKLAEAYQTEMIPMKGTARDYAANAYRLLEEA